MQIDDDTIQKYSHHHPRASRRRHFPNINQWSVQTITQSWTWLSTCNVNVFLNCKSVSIWTPQFTTLPCGMNSVLYITPDLRRYGRVKILLHTSTSPSDLKSLSCKGTSRLQHTRTHATSDDTIQQLTLSSDKLSFIFNRVLLCALHPSSIVKIN